MRVLHVIPAVAPRYGGPSSSIVDMCRALAEQGAEPLLVATDADGPGRLELPIGTPCRWQGVNTMFFARQWTEAFKYSRPLAAWLSRHIRAFSIVHVHGVLSHASLAAAWICRREKVPYIVRPLGTLDPWSLSQKGFRKRLLLRIAAHQLLREAAAIHYTSAEEKRGVEGALKLSGGAVIPLGVDPSLLTLPLIDDEVRQRDPYVLVLSRLHPVKNLEAFIEAFIDAASANRDAHWRLIVAGSGDAAYASLLENIVKRRRADDRVALIGWVDGEKKRELMRHASIFALPSLHENFGVSLVEALASGVPACVSRGVHLSEAIEHAGAGWVTEPDVGSMRERLIEAFGPPADRISRGRAARALAQRFAWPDVAAELLQMYRRIVANPLPLPVAFDSGRRGIDAVRR